MKRSSACIACIVALFFMLASNSFAQNTPSYVQTRILASFDGAEESASSTLNWTVTANNGQSFNGVLDPEPDFSYVNAYPSVLYNRNYPAPANAGSLGIRASFNRQGYNSLEIIPVLNGEIGAINISGNAQSIDVWAWGNDRNYYLEAHLRDYQGIDHVLRLGDLAYRGWRRLNTPIPSTIPQLTENPLDPSLVLTRLVLWTTPNERVDDFFVYIDELTVITDIYREGYDGDELADPDFVNTLWN